MTSRRSGGCDSEGRKLLLSGRLYYRGYEIHEGLHRLSLIRAADVDTTRAPARRNSHPCQQLG